jgi:hypothetical protein
MEDLKQVKNAIQVLLFPEPDVAHNSAPILLSDLFVVEPQANAQEDQNVDDQQRVVNWCAIQELPSLLELDADEEDSSHEKLAKLMELAKNKFIFF